LQRVDFGLEKGVIMRLALERGEADALFGGIAEHVRDVPDWFKGYSVPVIIKSAKGEGAEKYPIFPQNRPDLGEFANTPIKKALLAIYHTVNSEGYPGSGIENSERGLQPSVEGSRMGERA
jgi:hypothetical protein